MRGEHCGLHTRPSDAGVLKLEGVGIAGMNYLDHRSKQTLGNSETKHNKSDVGARGWRRIRFWYRDWLALNSAGLWSGRAQAGESPKRCRRLHHGETPARILTIREGNLHLTRRSSSAERQTRDNRERENRILGMMNRLLLPSRSIRWNGRSGRWWHLFRRVELPYLP
ncbi:hypothetical protein LIA77_09843 [Sarocladium implicatum]|nr:hypothetical protein LIA77_09843 [Sarocladium implicatum]